MILSLLLLIIFIIFAVLMYLNKLPALLALPIMAVLIAVFAGIPAPVIAADVIAGGSVRLSAAIITILFGSMLSQFVSRSGIAETLIKKVAELSGDNTLFVSVFLTMVVALLFTVLGGLGSVIMVASIVLPIMLSMGVSRVVAGSLFIMGMSLGGIFNLINWQLYMSVLGLSQGEILRFAGILGALSFITTLVFLFVETRRDGILDMMAEEKEDKKKPVSAAAMFTPVVPLVLVLGFSIYNIVAKPSQPFEFPIITAMIAGLIWGFFTTTGKDSVNLLTRSIYEGINSVGPAVALIMGIGMMLNAVMHPNVTSAVSPLLVKVLPSNPLYYVIFFTVLAPLSLYRGPLNIWGMGAGLLGLMLTAKSMPAPAIMAALLSVGQIQGVCDPTNTHNVWVSNYVNMNVSDILKRTIIYMWVLAMLGLAAGAFLFF